MACGCSKNRTQATARGTATTQGTYRVIVNGRQVYESARRSDAESVRNAYHHVSDVKFLEPGQ